MTISLRLSEERVQRTANIIASRVVFTAKKRPPHTAANAVIDRYGEWGAGRTSLDRVRVIGFLREAQSEPAQLSEWSQLGQLRMVAPLDSPKH